MRVGLFLRIVACSAIATAAPTPDMLVPIEGNTVPIPNGSVIEQPSPNQLNVVVGYKAGCKEPDIVSVGLTCQCDPPDAAVCHISIDRENNQAVCGDSACCEWRYMSGTTLPAPK